MEKETEARLKGFLDKGINLDFQLSKNTVGFGFGVYISNKIASYLSKIKIGD